MFLTACRRHFLLFNSNGFLKFMLHFNMSSKIIVKKGCKAKMLRKTVLFFLSWRHISIYIYIYLSIYLSIHPSIYLSICLYVRVYIYNRLIYIHIVEKQLGRSWDRWDDHWQWEKNSVRPCDGRYEVFFEKHIIKI